MSYVSADQSAFDFDKAEVERPLMEHWARLERIHREEWTDENRCIAWVTESDGRAWRDWWAAQPNYERSRMLMTYLAEREFAEIVNRPMRRYESFLPSAESLAQNREIIEIMKQELREAALARKPMPRRESEDMNPMERLTFRNRLNAAMLESGVVIVQGDV